jgi:hypothetical protein
MAFDKAMKMMGKPPKAKSKPAEPGEKKIPDEKKGSTKPTPAGGVEGEHGDGPGDAHSEIHSHLQAMHEKTGNAHTHIEHHFDGHHTSHHISEHGEMSGPHEHANTEELKGSMDQMGGGDQQVGNEPMPPQMPNHSMSGF